jgi:spermidine/putrescine transport system ATP-binding protein
MNHSLNVASAVEVSKVTKNFGDVKALNDVSVAIMEGEFFSLLGPSGCGKTTLLRMIGGFETPTIGVITIDGTDTAGVPPYSRNTNMIFQHLALFPHMNVIENVSFGLQMKRRNAQEIAKKVEEALNLVQLLDLGERKIDQLSGGQKQRVAMARALVNDPSVLLLDEPLGALDLQLRLQMQDELRRLHKSLGNTFVFVTHDQGEAMAMSDRIAVMDQGEILQIGTPEEIYERPKTRFVADFVGHANVFDGNVKSNAGNGEYLVTCSSIDFRCSHSKKLDIGQPVSIAVRYEDIRLGEKQNEYKGLGFGFKVIEKMYLGGMFRLETKALEGLAITSDLPSTEIVQKILEGDIISLFWEPNAVVVLTE